MRLTTPPWAPSSLTSSMRSQSWLLPSSPKPFQCHVSDATMHRSGSDLRTYEVYHRLPGSMYWHNQECQCRSSASACFQLACGKELGLGLIDCPELNSVFGCDVVVLPQQAMLPKLDSEALYSRLVASRRVNLSTLPAP